MNWRSGTGLSFWSDDDGAGSLNSVEAVTSIDFSTPDTLSAPAGYSHVVSLPAAGRLVWTAGQIPVAADGTAAPAGDWEAQTRLTFQNVGHALAAGGAGWGDVVKLTFYVVDLAGLPTIRAVRDEFVDVRRPPTSSLVKVAGLVLPELLLEVEAVACVLA
jgi:enamine deaminase RidA (YjgF/YER057c/UK114 family)